MNIVFVCLSLDVGGIESNLVLLTRDFVRKGHQVTVVSRGGSLERDIVQAGGRIEKIDFHFLKVVGNGKKLAAILLRLHPDIIHLFAATCCLATWVARTFCGLRSSSNPPLFLSSVMGLQNSPHELALVTQLRNWALTFGVDMTLMTSPAIARHFKRLPVNGNRLKQQLVCGVAVLSRTSNDEILRLRSELGLESGDRVVVTIGALEPRKSHDIFLQAAALVDQQHHDVKFLIAGEGYLRGELTQMIQTLGLNGKAQLLGMRRDIQALLSLADICVKPGVLDGFLGITVLEAQSVGTPVVAFDGEDVREAIIHDETGLLVNKGDVQDLASKLIELLDQPEKARRIGKQGKELVQKKFDIRVVATELLSLYDALRWQRSSL